MVEEGQKAPEFTLPATGGRTVSLADFRGKKNVVLYFYPKDDTPGCTKEACSFRDVMSEFEAVGAVILGVSTDSIESHEKFAAKHNLLFPLLSDEQKTVSTAYGVLKEKSMYGKTFLGVERTTFAIDKDGIVRKVWPNVKVEGHIDEVLDFVKTL
ncbi:MAG: thioredoxin-dependent thiol peroxidase [Armatimonadetes bacterium]|nr:thioredoxin-dependent thiol peroxidase [Armatimonadota bacterium]